jgi:hypothetical protein
MKTTFYIIKIFLLDSVMDHNDHSPPATSGPARVRQGHEPRSIPKAVEKWSILYSCLIVSTGFDVEALINS